MYLRLLGPFELTAPTGAVRVPGRGERALLAVLALSPSEVVTDTVLIEQLWSEADQPADPMNALQTRVSKVRRVLAAAVGGAPLVIRQGSGYRLDLDRQSVDVHCFASLVDAAHRAGAADQAIGCYDEALALWRAEPLTDFAGDPWASVAAARLVELRLVAIAERAERMLTLGRYDELVADLAPVVAAAPTRERLVGQLMTGLFNAGRQADALDVYARTREVLVDELGLDPSRELRSVMEQILRQDSAITPAPAVTRPDRPAGHVGQDLAAGNLPLRLTSFVGRDDEVARVTAALQRARLVTLVGPGGGGKTALALEAARHIGHGFPDGAWLVRLAPVTETDSLAHAVADGMMMSIEGGTVAHRPRDVLLGRLARREVLIVLDNCEHLIEPVAALVQTLLERCPGLRVLATSREALAVPGELQLAVWPLPVPPPDTATEQVPGFAAARLFLDRAEAVRPDLVADGAVLDAVAVICRRLDGIPLALELAAARLASLHPVELADRVRDRFAVLTSGDRTADARQRTLRNAVDWSHNLLTAAEQVLFRRLSVFRGGWTLPAAEAVMADAEVPTTTVLELLEWTFAVNHLAPFLLTNLLLDRLSAGGSARVVTISSNAQSMGRIDFDDLQGEHTYSGAQAYNQSKLANVMFTYELARRLEGSGVTANALHPGVVSTAFGAEDPGRTQKLIVPVARLVMKSPRHGAATSIYLASAPEVEHITGQFFANKKPRNSSKSSYDSAAAHRLWQVSADLVASDAPT